MKASDVRTVAVRISVPDYHVLADALNEYAIIVMTSAEYTPEARAVTLVRIHSLYERITDTIAEVL